MAKQSATEVADIDNIPSRRTELEELSMPELLHLRRLFNLNTGIKKHKIINGLIRLKQNEQPSSPTFAEQVEVDFPPPQYRDQTPQVELVEDHAQSSSPVLYHHRSSSSRRSFSAPSQDEAKPPGPREAGKRSHVFKAIRQIRLTAADGRPLVSARVVGESSKSSVLVAIGPPSPIQPAYLDDGSDIEEGASTEVPRVVERQPLGCITRQFIQVEDIVYSDDEHARSTGDASQRAEGSSRKSSITSENSSWDVNETALVEVPLYGVRVDAGNDEFDNNDGEDVENDENCPPSAQSTFIPSRKKFTVRINLDEVEKLQSDSSRSSAQKTIGVLAGVLKPDT